MAKSLRTATGGRAASNAVIPGRRSLSIGKPNLPEPEGWFWKSLSDVAQLETGHTPSRRKPEYWDGDIPWIGIRDATENHGRTLLDTKQHVTQQGIDNSSARILPTGTVCLSRTASVGYVVQMGVEMATSQDFVNWVCSDQLDPRFLKYLLLSEQEAIRRFATGTTHQTVYFPEAKAFHVLLPPPSEQRAIAHVLGTLDDKIEINRKMNETLEELARAIFKSWFVDFDPVKAKAEGRQPVGMDAETAALFPDSFEESEQGRIPAGWHKGTASDLFNRLKVRKQYNGKSVSPKGSIPVLDQSPDGYMGFHDNEPDFEASPDSPLVTFSNHRCYVRRMVRPFSVIQNVFPLEPRPEIGPNFMFYALESSVPVTEYKGHWSDFALKPVTIPAYQVSQLYEYVVIPFNKMIDHNISESLSLAELRDTLLPRLISGKLRIPDAEKLLAEAPV